MILLAELAMKKAYIGRYEDMQTVKLNKQGASLTFSESYDFSCRDYSHFEMLARRQTSQLT